MEQLSIFEEKIQPTNNMVNIRDIRTDSQKNKIISYDVGKKIGAARKDLFERKHLFLENPTMEILNSFEEEDVATAAELVTRDTFFQWFSLDDCQKREVEPMVAKGIQLLIRRISKAPADTRIAREQYVSACFFVSDKLKQITNLEEFKKTETIIDRMVRYEGIDPERAKESIRSYEESLTYEEDQEYLEEIKRKMEQMQLRVTYAEEANQVHLSSLGNTFRNYFCKQSSKRSTYEAMAAVTDWSDLIQSGSNKKPGTKRAPVWKRELPDRPDRHGGRWVQVRNPEEFATMFQFPAVEFGHYVEDKVAGDHLFRSAEALTDLADLLDVPITSLSLQGTLNFAFGSRGRGNALGHYEPSRKVINLTKQRGSLGILAHEFFHALDHYIFCYSYDFQNGKIGYVTEDTSGLRLPQEVQHAISDLVDSLTSGTAEVNIDVSGRSGRYRLYSSFKLRYERVEGNLKAFMDDVQWMSLIVK